MTCKECVHYEVCETHERVNRIKAKLCGLFKNKADVVPVLRCKECRYAEWHEDPILECKRYFCRLNSFCNVDEDDYCSKGKKRVEDV